MTSCVMSRTHGVAKNLVTPAPPRLTTRRAIACCVYVVVTPLACAALVCAAVLVPAPAPALVAIVPACIVCPIIAATELATALAVLRSVREGPIARRRVARLRRDLQRLPETEHPLGL
jgi:hypothetical protein